jgi:hypothetical protein
MESLIIFVIIGIISALFNKDKVKPEQKKPAKQMPSFGQQTVPEKSKPVPEKQKPAARSLEDFANEIFGQLNEKVEQPRETVPTKSVPDVNIAPVEVTNSRPTFADENVRRSARPQLAERPLTQKLKQKEVKFVPTTKQQLIQGIVMAEVLGPPKAKRK